jgi:hypothetical protein
MTQKNDRLLIKRLESHDLKSRTGPWTFPLLHFLFKQSRSSRKLLLEEFNENHLWLKNKLAILEAEHLICIEKQVITLSDFGNTIVKKLSKEY